MGEISYEDKTWIETLRKLGFGFRTIVAKFPEKGWKLCAVKAICKRVDDRGGSTLGPGGHRPPQMLARPPPDILVPTAKIRILKI